MLNIVFDNGWVNKVNQFVANNILRNVSVALLSNGQVIGYAQINEAGLTSEGFQIKATYINGSDKEVTYDQIAIYDNDGALIGTVSPNLTSIPPYKKIDIEVIIELM